MKNTLKYLVCLGITAGAVIVTCKMIKDTAEVVTDVKEEIKKDLGLGKKEEEIMIENVKYTVA